MHGRTVRMLFVATLIFGSLLAQQLGMLDAVAALEGELCADEGRPGPPTSRGCLCCAVHSRIGCVPQECDAGQDDCRPAAKPPCCEDGCCLTFQAPSFLVSASVQSCPPGKTALNSPSSMDPIPSDFSPDLFRPPRT
jgi:hypothetical protein